MMTKFDLERGAIDSSLGIGMGGGGKGSIQIG